MTFYKKYWNHAQNNPGENWGGKNILYILMPHENRDKTRSHLEDQVPSSYIY